MISGNISMIKAMQIFGWCLSGNEGDPF